MIACSQITLKSRISRSAAGFFAVSFAVPDHSSAVEVAGGFAVESVV